MLLKCVETAYLDDLRRQWRLIYPSRFYSYAPSMITLRPVGMAAQIMCISGWSGRAKYKRMILEARYSLKHNGLITKPFFYFN